MIDYKSRIIQTLEDIYNKWMELEYHYEVHQSGCVGLEMGELQTKIEVLILVLTGNKVYLSQYDVTTEVEKALYDIDYSMSELKKDVNGYYIKQAVFRTAV